MMTKTDGTRPYHLDPSVHPTVDKLRCEASSMAVQNVNAQFKAPRTERTPATGPTRRRKREPRPPEATPNPTHTTGAGPKRPERPTAAPHERPAPRQNGASPPADLYHTRLLNEKEKIDPPHENNELDNSSGGGRAQKIVSGSGALTVLLCGFLSSRHLGRDQA